MIQLLPLCMQAADLSIQGVACANSLDADQTPKNVGLLDKLILILQNN